MKKIKILGAQTHFKLRKDKFGKEVVSTGGVDLARVIEPLKSLPKDEFEVDIQHELVGGKTSRFKTTEELAKYYDIIYFSYMDTVQFYIELKVQGMKHGMKLAMDIDDNIWAVDPTHPYYKGDFEPGSEKNFNRSAMILDADALTTTNSFLRNEIATNVQRPVEDITVLPNNINLDLYNYTKVPLKRKTDEIVIGYMGGSSHFRDVNKPEFVNALKIIMKKYPNVIFKTSFFMPQLKAELGNRYRYALGRQNVYRFIDELWPQMSSECDIFVAPLHHSRYSSSKSYIKYLEYSASKTPCVMEDIDPYKEVLEGSKLRGFLASNTDDWVKHLSFLIDNPMLARTIGVDAYEYVKKNHTFRRNSENYANFFRGLTKK